MRRTLHALRFTTRLFFSTLHALHLLRHKHRYVTFLGSARCEHGHPYYTITYDLSRAIAKSGIGIITGGGPGLMEAANRGAKEVGSPSFGYNIHLPFEQSVNMYVDKPRSTKFFFLRKMVLINYATAFVIVPGGLGTMDEMFEILTLMQTNKIPRRPVYVYGTAYHKHLFEHINLMVRENMMESLDSFPVVLSDDVDAMAQAIVKYVTEHYATCTKEK